MKRVSGLTTVAFLSGAALLLSGPLEGCELLVDSGQLSEANPDATSRDASANGDGSSGSDGSASGMDATAGDADATAGNEDASMGDGSGGSDASDLSDAMTGNEAGPTSDAPTCSGPVYYVSPSGSDSNPGCSPTAPKKTIGGAIAAAKLDTASPPTIEVCAGTYDESNLQLDYAASLLGGFNCSTWAADAGAPAGLTTITNGNTTTQSATLVIFGSAVKLDGFTIQGGASPATDGGTTTEDYSALQISGPGTPTVSNNVLTGGSGAGGGPASSGVVVTGAAPLITGNTITGGSGVGGTNFAPASVGVFVSSGGAPIVRGNTIDGGSGNAVGASSSGSAGVMSIGAAGNITLEGNTISGGSGVVSNTTSTGPGSQAVWLWGSTNPVPALTVTGNVLLAGTGSVVMANTAGSAAVRTVTIGYASNVVFSGNTVDGGVTSSGATCPEAVNINGTTLAPGTVTVTGNRIHAGHCTAFATGLTASTSQSGLRVSGPFTSLTVENNMIDSGQVDVHRIGIALVVNAVSGAVVRHNTLVATGSSDYAFGLWLENSTTLNATTIENNIFAANGPNAVAITSDNSGVCLPDGGVPGVSSFRNNLVFGNLAGFLRLGCSGDPVLTSLDAMDTTFASQGATVAGNVTIASSCGAGDGGTLAGCITMPCAADGGTCLDTVFAGWDDTTTGYANLFSDAGFQGGCPAAPPPVVGGIGDGWALAAGQGTPPCVVARSSLNDVDAGALPTGVDLYGNCRGPHPSMGAAEFPPGASCF